MERRKIPAFQCETRKMCMITYSRSIYALLLLIKNGWRKSRPDSELPDERKKRYIEKYGLPDMMPQQQAPAPFSF